MGRLIKDHPGTRVPGAFNGFEMGLRAIIGQQITVKAATTIACRLVEAFSEPIVTPFAELNYLTPSPAKIAKASADQIARLGIVSARAKSIVALAQAHVSGALSLDSGAHHDPNATIQRLAELPGIGPWTAQYIAMRALRWPDAFPKEDIAVLNTLGGVTAKRAEEMSQSWRPWRSYAVLHLWRKNGAAIAIEFQRRKEDELLLQNDEIARGRIEAGCKRQRSNCHSLGKRQTAVAFVCLRL